jgi:hypothetical protein
MMRIVLLLAMLAGCQAKPVGYTLLEVKHGREKARDWAKAYRSSPRILECVQIGGSARSRSMADWGERRVDNFYALRVQTAVDEKHH